MPTCEWATREAASRVPSYFFRPFARRIPAGESLCGYVQGHSSRRRLEKGRSGCAGANGCPVRSFAAERSQVRLREDGGSGTGEDSVAWDLEAGGRLAIGQTQRGPGHG